MAIYSEFSHKNMVIFHSYVSLPEGTYRVNLCNRPRKFDPFIAQSASAQKKSAVLPPQALPRPPEDSQPHYGASMIKGNTMFLGFLQIFTANIVIWYRYIKIYNDI